MKAHIPFKKHDSSSSFAVCVWVGAAGSVLIGTYELQPRLPETSYLQFLSVQLPQLLDDVPFATWQTMWVLHDEAPALFFLLLHST
jgi:hypothetical protein